MSQGPKPLDEAYRRERDVMIETQLRRRGIRDERVLEAMRTIPRHEFVDLEYQSQAYEDHPIPIAEGQTISQPFIVALALQALELNGSESVLEVGTGTGYQTALLGMLARHVYSIERHALLVVRAQAVLRRIGLGNVEIKAGDGSRGWPEHSPYDAILVSAAAPEAPPSLREQLSQRGRMVVPVGTQHSQELQILRKLNGEFTTETLETCRFVPLIGTEGF